MRNWDKLEKLGLVKLEWQADDCAAVADLICSCEAPECKEEHQKPELEELRREGAWGLVGLFKLKGKWVNGGSVWGFIGQPKNTGYDEQIKDETVNMWRWHTARRHYPEKLRNNTEQTLEIYGLENPYRPTPWGRRLTPEEIENPAFTFTG